MRLTETITKAFDGATALARRALQPDVLAVLLSTQTACKPFENASAVPGMACAESLMAKDNSDWSKRMELFSGRDEGTGNDQNCSVRSYVAVDPQELNPLKENKIDKYLDGFLAAFAYPDESVFEAFDDEAIVSAQLTDNCKDFGLSSDGNFCVQACTAAGKPIRVVATDGCTNVVGIDGKDYDLFPAPSEAAPE